MTRNALQFIRSGRSVRIEQFSPRTTLLDWLRLEERSIGTKEGCAEGDCGACAVVVVRERDGRLVYEPVNSCITLLGQIDGAELITVEDLADDGVLHPVQEAMARDARLAMRLLHARHRDEPVRALSRRATARPRATRSTTRWREISAAAPAIGRSSMRRSKSATAPTISSPAMRRCGGGRSRALDDKADLFVGDEKSFFAAPASEAFACAALCATSRRHHRRRRDRCRAVDHQKAHADRKDHSRRPRGRACRTSKRPRTAARSAPSFRWRAPRRCWARSIPTSPRCCAGSARSRCAPAGTVGGSIANGSPIGDLAPMLIALGGSVELRHGDKVRRLPLENFFLDYGKQDRAPGEFVRRLLVPKLPPNCAFPRLQDHQAFRRGYFRGAGGVLPEGRRRPDQRSEGRVRRHGRNSQARESGRGETARPFADRHAAAGKRRPMRSARISRRSPICAPAPAIAAALPAIWSSRRSPKLPASARSVTRIADHRMVAACRRVTPCSKRRCAMCHKPLPHDSGAKHVQGSAEYIDDMPEPIGTLHIARRRFAGRARHASGGSILPRC